MAGVRPPLDPLTVDNTGAVVIVVTYSLLAVSIVVGVIRFWLQIIRSIPFGFDDGTYIVANLWAIGSTILWTLAVNAGLGARQATLSDSNIARFFKFEYAAQFLEIIAMFCAKAAFALLSDRVVPGKRWFKITACILIAGWALFSIFAIAFQCPLPHPWVFEPAQCPTHGYLYYPIIAINAVTDVALSAWVVSGVWRLQMRLRDRILVISLFCLRASILIPAITEMAMLHLYIDNSDQTRTSVNRVVLGQIIVYISVMTSAIPRTNQFLFNLRSFRNAVVIPDYEIYEAGQLVEPKPDPPLQLVPPGHNNEMSTTVVSEASNHPSESDTYSPRSVTVRRELVIRESNRRRAEGSESSHTRRLPV